MHYDRPIVLSIGGFDPSGGAGVLADTKTMEQNGCLGMAVLTATTVQTENELKHIQWFSLAEIIEQIEALISVYSIRTIKIGIVENLDILEGILTYLSDRISEVEVVWDPVLRSSSGFTFTANIDPIQLNKILKQITLITPNAIEILQLSKETEELIAGEELSKLTAVLLKGGHRLQNLGEDVLFHAGNKWVFSPSELPFFEKHGSGCILSSAVASQLALGKSLPIACEIAKEYVARISQTSPNKLGYHVA